MLFLYDFKMFQCRFYGCIHLLRWTLTRTLQFVLSVWCIVHRQADFTLYFRHICRMNFEAVFSSIRFWIFLYIVFSCGFLFSTRFAIAVLSSEVLLKSIFTSRWESGFCGIIPPTSQRRLNSHTAAYSLCRYRNRSGKTIFAIINNRSVIKDIVISYVK